MYTMCVDRRLAIPAMLLALASTALAQPTFIPIGDLSGGDPLSFALAVSGNGAVAVGASASTASGFQDDAFRFSIPAGPIRTLTTTPTNNDLPGGSFKSTAFGVNGNGTMAVGSSTYNGVRIHAFVWSSTNADTLVDLGNIANQVPPLAATNDISWARAISSSGNVIVGQGTNSTTLTAEACVWINGQPGAIGLGDLPGGSTTSIAHGVSGNGAVIVGESQSANGREAFRSPQAGGLIALGDAAGGAFDSAAFDASENGQVIVGYCTTANGLEAARWLGPSYTLRALGDLPGGTVASEAAACSANGLILVGRGDSGRQIEIFPGFFVDATDAFVWDIRNGMRKLSDLLGPALPTGWLLDSADGISDDGTVIVGSATNPAGDTEGYIAILPRFCLADINQSGAATVQDIFDFLSAYFANSPLADANGDATISVQDIFDFLTAYFSGC